MTDAENQRQGHPVADLLGAILRGGRPEDAKARRRAQKWIAGVTGGGLAIWIAVAAVNDWRAAAHDGRAAALDRLSGAITAQANAIKEQSASIDNLVWTLWEVQNNGSREHIAIMRRLGVAPVAPVVRPPKHNGNGAVPSSNSTSGTYDPISGMWAP